MARLEILTKNAEFEMSTLKAYLFLTLSLFWLLGGSDALGQCILANPSFEMSGSGGQIFGGWNQFGSVGWSTDATHGAKAARVSGLNLGGWDVSAYWQSQDSAPGDRWSASVRVWHTSTNPLTGQSTAMVNIEWRDASGVLIDFESHTAADASTPVDQKSTFSVQSNPAPLGTAETHILFAVLQAPTDPKPDVFYDEATFENLGPPTLDELQWSDFPGGRAINFSGRTWRVKGPGFYGPGPNLFCDSANCTWVDVDDRLHMTIQNLGGSWYSTEVTLEEALGYGDYIFTTLGRLDNLHPDAVLGLFIWQYGPCWDPSYLWWNPFNEIDVEFSRWANPGNDVGQFVAQPYDYPGNINRFNATFSDGELTSHAFRWLSDRVEYRSWRGGPQDESPANLIHSWTYTGPHIPRPEQPRVHINLWQFTGPPSSDQEVVLDEFTFIPDSPVVGVPGNLPLPGLVTHLSAASPNPFTPSTTIRFRMPTEGSAGILVYDVSGRLIRTLVDSYFPAGEHEAVWNGQDDAGNRVASGVYLYQLRAGSIVETKRVIFLN
jgi:hypothetical protein